MCEHAYHKILITLVLFWKKDRNICCSPSWLKKNVFQQWSVYDTLYTDFAKLFQVPKAFYLYVLHDNNEIQLLQVIQWIF